MSEDNSPAVTNMLALKKSAAIKERSTGVAAVPPAAKAGVGTCTITIIRISSVVGFASEQAPIDRMVRQTVGIYIKETDVRFPVSIKSPLDCSRDVVMGDPSVSRGPTVIKLRKAVPSYKIYFYPAC